MTIIIIIMIIIIIIIIMIIIIIIIYKYILEYKIPTFFVFICHWLRNDFSQTINPHSPFILSICLQNKVP